MAEIADDLVTADTPCPQGREDRCRLRALLRARHVVTDISGAWRGPPIAWEWKYDSERNAVFGVWGGETPDICACLISYARGELLELLALDDDTNPQIELVLNWVRNAVHHGLGPHRRAAIRVYAPKRPAWLPEV